MRRCVCERWRFSDVTLSSMAAVLMSQDIWDRAAIWLPENRDWDKRRVSVNGFPFYE